MRAALVFLVWVVGLAHASGIVSAQQPAASVLLAIEAARNASTPAHRLQAAVELETLAHEDAPGAASALAALILEGKVDASDEAARRWALRGHEAGDADATMLLARMFAQGMGGEKSTARAAELAREAAMAGLPAAGLLVYELLIDTHQFEAALAHLMRAAESGHPQAQQLLGMHFAAGRDLERDDEEAYFWLLLAEAHGVSAAASMVDSVAQRLTSDVRHSVILSTLEWRPR